MKSEIEICILIRWNNPSVDVAWRETERFLDWLQRNKPLSSAPLHWNIPSYPFLEDHKTGLASLLGTIKERMKAYGDTLVPMGYSGAIQPLLSLPELEKEVSWSLTNPWGSGIADIFGVKADTFMPAVPDGARPEAQKILRLHNFTRIAIPMDFDSYCNQDIYRIFENFRLFAFVPMCADTITQLKLVYKKKGTDTPSVLFLVFDLSQCEETVTSHLYPEAAQGLFDYVARKRTISFVSLGNIKGELPDIGFMKAPACNSLAQSNTPILRRIACDIGKLRSGSVLDDECIRKILKAAGIRSLGFEKEKTQAKKNRFPSKERMTIADMQGNAILSGRDFDVYFSEGKLVNFIAKNKPLLAGIKSNSYVTLGGAEYPFLTVSSSSIESDSIRGLRVASDIIVPGEEDKGAHITDYIFIEDFPSLAVSTLVRYPRLTIHDTVDRIAPIEIALFRLEGKDTVSLDTYIAGVKISQVFGTTEGKTLVSGNYFCLSKGDISVETGYLEKSGLRYGTLEINLYQDNNKNSPAFVFAINPIGTYHPFPSAYYSGKTEIISFYIGLTPCVPPMPPPIPTHVLREIP